MTRSASGQLLEYSSISTAVAGVPHLVVAGSKRLLSLTQNLSANRAEPPSVAMSALNTVTSASHSACIISAQPRAWSASVNRQARPWLSLQHWVETMTQLIRMMWYNALLVLQTCMAVGAVQAACEGPSVCRMPECVPMQPTDHTWEPHTDLLCYIIAYTVPRASTQTKARTIQHHMSAGMPDH